MRADTSRKRLVIVAAVAAALCGVPASPATGAAIAAHPGASPGISGGAVAAAIAGDPVVEWNQEAARLAVLSTSGLAPVQQLRVMAIVQVGVHDAVNGITGEYATYLPPVAAPEGASPEAAAIAAAHHALKALFAAHAGSLDALYAASLAAHGLSGDDPGVEYGRTVAAAILALRADDGSAQAQFAYTAPGAGEPGVFVPLVSMQQPLLAGWGEVTPWALRSGSQFRPGPPPALDSERYAMDYNEIKAIGASNSATRTAEQTQIARFWRFPPVAIWNPVLIQALAARDFDLSTTARTFALLYLAAADASIACWDAKYAYNYWRPQPAIANGHLDGNDATEADAAWTPLLPTPPHPEYPSGHSTVSSAMAAILEQVFGDDPGVQFVVTLDGITRQWSTFDEGVDEVIEARIYSGIHFRTADEVGARLGRQVARFASTHALRRCPSGRGPCF